ncbi:MAG TPA: YdeI/OmpD-associated family protein [Patescibacteria group bacterium]|nr:YdeI/OmpD-associated family protein [Patescibacteria group bacterium]
MIATKKDLQILPFASQQAWEEWLSKNHTATQGLWLKIAKKASGIATVTYDEALEVALCYGWIDGQSKSIDENFYIQKFVHRGSRSMWSKRNCDIVTRLIKEKKMKQAGLAEIDAAKKDGRWERAYDSPKNMQIPDDFLQELGKNKKAEAFFKSLNKTNLYSIGWRLQTAKKPETRVRRMEAIIAMLAKGEKFH